ncbi:MAG TPA: nucleotidyltransferase domain-containing protein [Thermoanaerobaculia bacterium]|nr:nucleotidyltransferase domain-containing protein [Thermoanaerobaculia bacterium]
MIDLNALRAALTALSEVELAVVFGSSARGRSSPRSDVDLALRLKPSTPEARRKIVAAARAAVLREIDDIDLDTAPALLRLQIARHGLLLVEREPRSWAEFKAKAMTDWWDWAPTARWIHAAYIRRLREQTAHGGA